MGSNVHYSYLMDKLSGGVPMEPESSAGAMTQGRSQDFGEGGARTRA